MYFILNKSIKFIPATNELCLVLHDGNSILISNAASRLLDELIRNVNEISTRDELLQKVWEDYGYTSSYNNVYMAVSELRKAITTLGHSKNIIITVPKIGIKLVADVDIFELNRGQNNRSPGPTLSGSESTLNSSEDTMSDLQSEKISDGSPGMHVVVEENRADRTFHNYRWLTLPFILLIGMGSLYLQHLQEFSIQKLSLYDSFDFQACRIYIINRSAGYDIAQLRDKALHVIDVNKINCKNGNKSIYFQGNFLRSGLLAEYTLGICSRNEKKNSCETIKHLAG
jgi:DNA-binding winged helix-turn-helix (wHTH) protein